jgi:toxin CcdB
MEILLMARFDIYLNPGAFQATTPYLLDVQSELLDGLDSRMVIPLRSLSHFAQVKLPSQLCPVFHILGQDYLLETPKMAAVPQRLLKSPVASLATHQGQVTGALDFLFQGY